MDAVKIYENAVRRLEKSEITLGEFEKLIEPLRNVSEKKTGKWIEEDDFVICSECGEEHGWIAYRANFCENCGADMRGEQDG